MIKKDGGDASAGQLELTSGGSEGMDVLRDIRYGFTYEVPPVAEETRPEDATALARWIVRTALWSTVTAGEGFAAGEPRSTTEGTARGLPVFNVPNVAAGSMEATNMA